MKIKKLEKLGIQAVRTLRRSKLNRGQPFMINSPALPSDQCYLEYPDGSFKLATINKKNNDFEIIDELSPEKIILLRKKYRLVLASNA